MMQLKRAIWVMIIAWIAASASADTVYRWTDADGIKRFSNEPPPASVKTFEIIETQSTPTEAPAPQPQRRPSYDQMVERASSEADQLRNQREVKQKAAVEKNKQLANDRRKAEIEAKRKKLEGKIADIQRRAVSPTYPKGMKEAQIQKIREQIDQLAK